MTGPGGGHLGDTGDGQRRGLGTGGHVLQCLGAGRVRRVHEVERLDIPVPRQLVGIGQARMRILGRLARHRHGPFGHGPQRVGAGVAGRDAGLPPSDQDAQADLDPFGAFGMFQPALQDVDRDGTAVDRQRIGRVGAGGTRRVKQRFGQVGQVLHGARSLGLAQQVVRPPPGHKAPPRTRTAPRGGTGRR